MPGGRALRAVVTNEASTPIAAVLLLALVVVLQVRNGAFTSELGGHPDESGHYVTGLMVRQFALSGQWTAPMRFAEDYYAHYPKVAFGHWPPLFYALQAAWTLVFSPTRASVILLVGVLCAALALVVYRALRDDYGVWIAGLGALLVVGAADIQKATSMVMTEMLVAVLSLSAALAFGRFMDTERWRDAVAFGVLASAAIMTKGNGMALALVPPGAIVLSQRWRLLRMGAFWGAAAIVVICCGPWYWVTARLAQDTFVGGGWPTPHYATVAARYYAGRIAGAFGILSLLGLLGAWDRLVADTGRRSMRGKWPATAALLVAVWAFHCLVPSSVEARHMVFAIPPLALFVGAGVARLVMLLPVPETRRGISAGVAAVTALAVFGVQTFTRQPKAWHGFAAVADEAAADPRVEDPVILVSSDSSGEGMLISEIAMREPQPRLFVLRASRVLARSGWNGENYELVYHTAPEIAAFLDRAGVDAITVDDSPLSRHLFPHNGLLKEAVEADHGRWRLVARYPATRNGLVQPAAIALYRRVTPRVGGDTKVNLRQFVKPQLLGGRRSPGQ